MPKETKERLLFENITIVGPAVCSGQYSRLRVQIREGRSRDQLQKMRSRAGHKHGRPACCRYTTGALGKLRPDAASQSRWRPKPVAPQVNCRQSMHAGNGLRPTERAAGQVRTSSGTWGQGQEKKRWQAACGIVVRCSAGHAEDPASIPDSGILNKNAVVQQH